MRGLKPDFALQNEMLADVRVEGHEPRCLTTAHPGRWRDLTARRTGAALARKASARFLTAQTTGRIRKQPRERAWQSNPDAEITRLGCKSNRLVMTIWSGMETDLPGSAQPRQYDALRSGLNPFPCAVRFHVDNFQL